MRCKKLGRIYFRYIDGRLSERQSSLVKEHIRDCHDCAAEAESLERVRSLLRTAGRIEMSDAYWDTYWDRLQKRLPGEPLPVTLKSRMLGAIAALLRQPAILGRIAIYILVLTLLLYTTPDRLIKVAPKPRIPGRASSDIADKLTSAAPLESQTLDRRRVLDTTAGFAVSKPKDDTFHRQMEYAEEKGEQGIKHGLPKTEALSAKARETYNWPASAESTTALRESLGEVRDDRQDVVDDVDEYVAAESYFRRGEYLQAIPAYQNFIAANLDDNRTLKAMYQIGEANYQMGNYSEALANFTVLTDEEVSKAFGTKRNDYQKKGEHVVVSEFVSRLRSERKSDTKAKRSETSRGMAALGDGLQRNGDRPETPEELISRAMFRQAQSYEHLGKREEALAAYRRYVERYPQGEYLSQSKEKITQIAR